MIVEPTFYLPAIAMATVAVATFSDLLSHRIPNKLTVPVALLGLVLQAWVNGLAGLADGFLGLLVAFFAFLPFYLTRWMAAGDIKLLMAVGACPILST